MWQALVDLMTSELFVCWTFWCKCTRLYCCSLQILLNS